MYDHVRELRALRMEWPTSVAFLRGVARKTYWNQARKERLIEAAEEIEWLQAKVTNLQNHVG